MFRGVACLAITAALLLVSAVASATSSDSPVVKTAAGRYRGYRSPHGSYAFKGIRYATSPTGLLRFRPPVAAPEFDGVANATVFAPGCIAKCPYAARFRSESCAATVDEDCLFLNVYTPVLPASRQPEHRQKVPVERLEEASAKAVAEKCGSKPLPVIFFIHGGAFQYGSGGIPLYDGSRWAAQHCAVIVTINYRLGVFEALVRPDQSSNLQILDQRFALEWVRNEIGQFGGDARRVMVSGESAGGISASIHLTSPASYPLFTSAAVLSNGYGSGLYQVETGRMMSDALLYQLGCYNSTKKQAHVNSVPQRPTASAGLQRVTPLTTRSNNVRPSSPVRHQAGQTEDQQQCLRTFNASYLLEQSNALANSYDGVWMPFIDGVVVPQDPMHAMLQGRFHTEASVYLQTTANESVFFTYLGYPKPMPYAELKTALTSSFNNATMEAILKVYDVPSTGVDDYRPIHSRINTDALLACPNQKVADAANRFNNYRTFVAVFDAHTAWQRQTASSPTAPCARWVCHASGLASLFNTAGEYPIPPESPAEAELANFMQSVYTNLAAGEARPTPTWAPFVGEQFGFVGNLTLGGGTRRAVGYPVASKCAFWDRIIS